MSKKTVKRHYKKHRKKRTYRKHNKKHFKRSKRKCFKRINNGTVKGVQLFTEPEKLHFESISVNKDQQSGNMIPGLRNM